MKHRLRAFGIAAVFFSVFALGLALGHLTATTSSTDTAHAPLAEQHTTAGTTTLHLSTASGDVSLSFTPTPCRGASDVPAFADEPASDPWMAAP